ncbi:hypothetical protein AB0M79_29940 [Polymorphospora sp. NPDC051019]|uniref:hypothetical protein n=1 Tax=Polymorphospora sp. NPDC051019 TaxID=3155725 RepID=UPI003417E55E
MFAVEYLVCPYCKLGWAEKPYTVEKYQRNGLASAGLEALRKEDPRVAWHTAGGHLGASKGFWSTVGEGVPGGYHRRALCEHVERHGGLKPFWRLKRR